MSNAQRSTLNAQLLHSELDVGRSTLSVGRLPLRLRKLEIVHHISEAPAGLPFSAALVLKAVVLRSRRPHCRPVRHRNCLRFQSRH
jgi:hypothetical protein